jgi:superfamily II DNA or RNA helicase
MEEIAPTSPQAPKTRTYWQAQATAELALSEFRAATEKNDPAGQRRAFYRLASYYGRTMHIVSSALAGRKEPLAQAAMSNLVALHRPLAQMHRVAPDDVPVTLTLNRKARDEFVRDLVVRVLAESAEALRVDTVHERVNDLDVMGNIRRGTVERHLKNLVATGHVERAEGRYRRSDRVYAELDMDALSLRALTGNDLYGQLVEADFRGLREVDARQGIFRQQFVDLTGLSEASANQFVEVAATLLDTQPGEVSAWRHADLVGSSYPRPYQYEAYAVFRGRGYQGQLVESPTGSGKTMIGMMCIQDLLRSVRPGQSILVLVPTINYQQQWIGELCYKPIGLRLAPEFVFAGTPAQLERFQHQTGSHPAVLLMTYTALAQTGSGVGKGGFDIDSIEIFLQGANVQYVILDEVHKVVENMKSVSADVTRVMVDWLKDGSIRGLIGFSGTAESYRPRFAQLGLELAYNIPLDDLIAYGFVAPFAEFGVPFANSERERQIRKLLDAYKRQLRNYFKLLGGERVRGWFAEVPLAQRKQIGRTLLGMYQSRTDWEDALETRLVGWESGKDLKITDALLVTILQIARDWSDEDLVQQAEAGPARFETIRRALDQIREDLIELIYLPDTMAQLQAPGFTTTIDGEALQNLYSEVTSAAERVRQARGLLVTTITGLYRALSIWYRRVGEGRVETIKAIIEAERAKRPVSGIIVFDSGRKIHWRKGLATPGYEGVGGLFAEMLGDDRFTAFAVLSSEMYITYDEHDPLPPHIARFIEDELMRGEVAGAIFKLATQGLDLDPKTLDKLDKRFTTLIDRYIPRLVNIRATRRGEFSRRVLNPMRRSIRSMKLGPEGQRLLARLHRRNVHLSGLVQTFFDYALLAAGFRRAQVAELEQVSGARQEFFVVKMPGGSRKQLMYDLTSRIVDSESLSVNLVIVSSWARTGWNVIEPNVLIDATATRHVTAWQQLRGRAIRSLHTWTNDCYRLILVLTGSRSEDFAERADLSEDVTRIFEETAEGGDTTEAMDERLRALLDEVAPPDLAQKIDAEGLSALSDKERNTLAIELMEARNKVTHIYELIKAFGSTSQVTYNRTEQVWTRRKNIARKHAYEVCIQPFTGEKVRGAAHAPLLYVKDPRRDLPSELEIRVAEVIDGRDEVIVTGWMKK